MSKRRRIIIYSDSSEEENSDKEWPCNKRATGSPHTNNVEKITENLEINLPEEQLDPELLSALGEPLDDSPDYGENIHTNLSQRWSPILKKGLTKEDRENLIKEYKIPDNCKLFQAPTLNPEISAAVTEASKMRDKKLQHKQQQLGAGLTALNRALTLLLKGNDKIKTIKLLSDSSRILSDLHFLETETRTKLLSPGLDKTFLKLIENAERDETIFGEKLSERIKMAKTIAKQGLQLKKSVEIQKTSMSRLQGNGKGPFRLSSNRGGRGAWGGSRTTAASIPPAHRAHQTHTTTRHPSKSTTHSKRRVPIRHYR